MKMTRIILLIVVTSISMCASAQDKEDRNSSFKKENIFTGGTLNLSFGNNITALGLSPFFGYSINKYVDVAASVGVNYLSQRDYSFYNSNDKLRQTIYGPGAFVRVFPLKFLFFQSQYEYNLIRYKYIPAPNSGFTSEKRKLDASSMLLGGGFASGRDASNNTYYYFSILWDVANSINSPYKDNLQRAIPIIRAGYNIALFQGRRD
jgi:hypothetical protein